MALNADELIHEVMKLSAFSEMKTSLQYSSRSGAAVGLATMISGLLAGPAGLVIGGVVSSCAAGFYTWGKFQSVPDIIINDTTPEQKEKLAKELRKCINSRTITNIRDFIVLLQTNEELMQAVIQILVTFLSSELGRKVIL